MLGCLCPLALDDLRVGRCPLFHDKVSVEPVVGSGGREKNPDRETEVQRRLKPSYRGLLRIDHCADKVPRLPLSVDRAPDAIDPIGTTVCCQFLPPHLIAQFFAQFFAHSIFPLIPDRYKICEVREPVDEGMPADPQRNDQPLQRFVTTSEPILSCPIRFVVLKVVPQVFANGVDGIGELDVDGSPTFTGLIVHIPPPVSLDVLGRVALERFKKVSVKRTVLWEVRVVIIACLDPRKSCWKVGSHTGGDLANGTIGGYVVLKGRDDRVLVWAKHSESRLVSSGECAQLSGHLICCPYRHYQDPTDMAGIQVRDEPLNGGAVCAGCLWGVPV